MKTLSALFVTASVVTFGLGVPVMAETAKPAVVLVVVDPAVLATGWRATTLIGSAVYNDAGEEIGTLEDMIITSKETVPYVLVSVGGFLGMNAHHVVVAASALEMVGTKLTLHGATKDSLKALPNFTFAS